MDLTNETEPALSLLEVNLLAVFWMISVAIICMSCIVFTESNHSRPYSVAPCLYRRPYRRL
uniref:Uncharacterized protein n=1 Tax=Megaviridae environmental sample TaxID=1737588 RepID=A0A5J6VIT1_9VIRU|nr:MAG: hypothetical protein [Megaviridae environmental sample]